MLTQAIASANNLPSPTNGAGLLYLVGIAIAARFLARRAGR